MGLDIFVKSWFNISRYYIRGVPMKRLNQLSERDFLSRFFAAFSLSFLIAAFCMPDRADMLPGLWRILSSPTLSSTNFFSLGGYAATFLNILPLTRILETALVYSW